MSSAIGKKTSSATEKNTAAAPKNIEVLEVSGFLPECGVNPILTKYKQYLQSCYNARVLAPADKYLPTLQGPYINLAMIKKGQPYNPDQKDEFTRQTLHGGVDQILDSKTPINIEDLLTPENSRGSPVRFILVEGPPGIGKSTFAWEVCRRWDEIDSLRNYHTVVLLKLKEKWVLDASSLSDLLRYPSHPDFSASIAEELVQSQGKNLLFVLDGFDEVSHSFCDNSVIKSILCRQLLPQCTIILTTRPVAKATLENICQPQVDKHVEIIGFTEEERVKYITEVFSKEPELQINYLKYMFLVPHIKSMMYIPLNCAIIAQVYYETQINTRHIMIPRTRTQLYKALTHSLLARHMKMKQEYTSILPEGLNEEDMRNFKALAKFAFDSYHEGCSKKVTFFQDDIPDGLVHFGFMNESTQMYVEKGVERTFSFLHLSLQEYLAAWHLADSYSIEFQVAYYRLATDGCRILYKGDNKDERNLLSSLQQQGSSLVEPAIFLAGITGWKCQSKDVRNHWEIYLRQDSLNVAEHSVFLRSLYEAQNPEMVSHYFSVECAQYFHELGGISQRKQVTIDSDFSPYDCYALSYCLTHYSPENLLSVSLSITSDLFVETFVKGLNDHCKAVTPGVKSLQIYSNIDKVSHAHSHLCQMQYSKLRNEVQKSSLAYQLIKSLVKLQSLTIHLGSDTPWVWLAALKFINDLKVLHISGSKECSPLPKYFLCWFPGDALIRGNNLNEVLFYTEFPSNNIHELCSPTDRLISSVMKSILISKTNITKIVLPNISRETMTDVRGILLYTLPKSCYFRAEEKQTGL